MNRRLAVLLTAIASLFISPLNTALGTTVTLGTTGNAANWLIAGAGATAVSAYQTSANHAGEISITSNGLQTGTFPTGASLAAFDGFWFADETFTLPAGATGTSLSFDSLYGNDRVVLELNGTIIGNADHLGATGPGVMSFPPGPPDVAYTITGTTSGTVTSGFQTGINTLRLIVNNTGVVPITGATATFQAPGDATDAFVNATVTYAAPEPTAALFLLLGSGAMLLRRRRGTV